MKTRWNKFLYGGLSIAVLFCPLAVSAQEAAKPEATGEAMTTLSAEFVDPAFARYIDLAFLGAAWENQDAAALTDAAVQLAEGEKVLFRSHKAFTSKSVFEKALAVAADKKDAATLERLGKIAKACDCKDFAAEVARTTKLASESRALVPNVDFLKISEDGKANYYYINTSDLISRVRVAGDKKGLASIKEEIKQVKPEGTVTKESIDALLKLADESETVMGDIPADEQNIGLALEKLAGESRGPGGPPPMYPWGPKPWPPGPGPKPWPPYPGPKPWPPGPPGGMYPPPPPPPPPSPMPKQAMTPIGPVMVYYGPPMTPPTCRRIGWDGYPHGPVFSWDPMWGPPPPRW